jgi:hypothetical protein
VAASSDQRRYELLLPDGFEPNSLIVNGRERPFEISTVESSHYACFEEPGAFSLHITLAEN